jgi:hypothetical protein
MNKTLLDHHVRIYCSRIYNSLIWGIDNYFKEFISEDERFEYILVDRDFWISSIDANSLNRNWIKFCTDNNFNANDTNYAILYILSYLDDIENELEDKTAEYVEKYDTKDIFIKGLSLLIDSNYDLFKDYFHNEKIRIFENNNQSNNANPEPIQQQIKNDISWDNQTELSELIYVLFHSKRVLKNGKPIQQKELTELLNQKSMKSYKKDRLGKTFMSELNSLLEKYKTETINNE